MGKTQFFKGLCLENSKMQEFQIILTKICVKSYNYMITDKDSGVASRETHSFHVHARHGVQADHQRPRNGEHGES